MTPKLGVIVAHDLDRAIGLDGRLPWHLPDDLKHFKALTLGHSILMGRKTFDSIGRPLPGRRNLVLTRNASWCCDGVQPVASLEAARSVTESAWLWVIGGGEVYAQTIDLAERIELTLVDVRLPAADTWFPAIDREHFDTLSQSHHPRDERHALAFDFLSLARRSTPLG
jgi:dihydrofolate reductase